MAMNEYERMLKQYMKDNRIEGEHLVFEQSCHSVEEAARAANADPRQLVKNICLIDNQGDLIVAIVSGGDRVSTSKVGRMLGIEPPRIAESGEIEELTGYPCGGVPSFGYPARFLIDSRVLEQESVLSGGGSQNSLVKIKVQELRRANQALVGRIRK